MGMGRVSEMVTMKQSKIMEDTLVKLRKQITLPEKSWMRIKTAIAENCYCGYAEGSKREYLLYYLQGQKLSVSGLPNETSKIVHDTLKDVRETAKTLGELVLNDKLPAA